MRPSGGWGPGQNTSGGKLYDGVTMCRVFEAGCPSCLQPVLEIFTGPHPFFNHQQTHERRDVTPFYVSSLQHQYPQNMKQKLENLSRQRHNSGINCHFCDYTWISLNTLQQSRQWCELARQTLAVLFYCRVQTWHNNIISPVRSTPQNAAATWRMVL